MSREAVLLQWERKIEVAERLEDESADLTQPVPLRPPQEGPRRGRFEREASEPGETEPNADQASATEQGAAEPSAQQASAPQPAAPAATSPRPSPELTVAQAERRTITIKGQPTAARRRRPVVDAQLAQPDRIALWAFLLGLLLVAVAAGTAHA